MSRTLQALLKVDVMASEPDRYEIADGNTLPPISLVMSRNYDGSTLSTFSDNVWDFSPYANTSATVAKLRFHELLTLEKDPLQELLREAKWIMFLLIYFPTTGRAGYLAVSTLYCYHIFLLSLCRFAHRHNVKLRDILSREELLRLFLAENNSLNALTKIGALLKFLQEVGDEVTGFTILGRKVREPINQCAQTLFGEGFQTPIIPPRIYQNVLKQLNDRVNLFAPYKEKMESLVTAILRNNNYARSKDAQRKNGIYADQCFPEFSEAIQQHGLQEYCSSNNIKHIRQLVAHLTILQTTCKVLLIAFTGMRSSEADSLMYYCSERELSDTGKVIRLIGKTTKLLGVKKTVRWVTSIENDQVIQVAHSLARPICSILSIDLADCPLFISILPILRESTSSIGPAIVSRLKINKKFINAYKSSLTIEASDLKEMSKFTPEYPWETDDNFRPGKLWPLGYHQFRRSLAVYAAQSGLVSLPTLKRQLKHITREMTLYYCKGSTSSKGLFNADKDHIAFELAKVKPEADSIAYIYEVLMSDEPVYGGHINWLNHTENRPDATKILGDRTTTIARFKKGEMSFNETPLGACMSTKACDRKALRAIAACIDCDKSVIKISNLQRVISAQRELLQRIEPGSMLYKMETGHLLELERFYSKVGGNNVSFN